VSDALKIELQGDHALVLYDLIARLNATGKMTFEDQAEQRVLWDLESELERHLTATFATDYDSQVKKARARVRDTEE
jgi:hypothetical protein